MTVFPDGTSVTIAADQDPREVFANWLISKDNAWFARNLVNHVWYWLMGRGVIHEPDDLRSDNPPSNPKLLEFLEQEFVQSGYDLKQLYRLIVNSSTYQQSCICAANDPAGPLNFGCYPVRRLEAELLIDALNQITGSTETYSSPIPEPFTFLPENMRSVTIPDGSITSPFLEMFGRPPRDTGLASERNNRISSAQRLHLLNSSHIQRKIEQGPKLRPLLRPTKNPRLAVTELYLAILSRFPTDEELQTVAEYAQVEDTPAREKMIDLAWALINSTEFIYRH